MNSLTVVIGPMFSGKTSRIVHFSSKWARRGKRVIVISHSLDDRGFLSHNPKLKLDDDVTVIKTRELREVDIDDFVDIVGRNFRQPEEGLGWDSSPSAHMWRTLMRPTRYL